MKEKRASNPGRAKPAPPPAPPSPYEPGRFRREWLAASAVWLLLQLWVFRAPLWTGGVDSVQQSTAPIPTCLFNMFDPVAQVLPSLFSQTRQIKQGIFPAWAPGSQAGTPLIAKMQNGVFAPPHLLLYLLPAAWLPYSFMLVIALQGYLAFLFTYLFARTLGLRWGPGVFAATIFSMWLVMRGELLPNMGVSGLYQPLLLLLVELHALRRRGQARALLPFASAFSFLGGHFESAVYANLAAGAYALLRIGGDNALSSGEKLRGLAELAGLLGVGALMAAVQIAPAVEYVHISYNNIWHGRRWFDLWDQQTVGKYLSLDDAALLLVGFGALAGFAALLRKSPAQPARSWMRPAAGVLLAVSLACLINLGFDATLAQWSYAAGGTAETLLFFFLLFLGFWAWARSAEPGPRALGWLLLIGLLIEAKTPLVNNVLIHIPPFDKFHNTSNRWDVQIAMATLAALAFSRALDLAKQQWSERLRAASGAWSALLALSMGFCGGRWLQGGAARMLPAGVAFEDPSAPGGIIGPRHAATDLRRHTIAGWMPASAPIASIAVGVARGNQAIAVADATAGAVMSGSRIYFSKELALPDEPGEGTVFAQIRGADGRQRLLRGTTLELKHAGTFTPGAWGWLAALAAFPLIFLFGELPLRAAFAAAFFVAVQYKAQALPRDQMPFKLPGIEKIKEDPGLFRVTSLKEEFLRADYLNVYGLADIRTGGDFLDALTTLYFNRLFSSFLANPQDPKAFDAGMRLLGLANVKYLVAPPGTVRPHPALEPYYTGPDMTVFKNTRLFPRAMFFDRAFHLPMGDWMDWGAQNRFMAPAAQWLMQDPERIGRELMLNDPPEKFAPPKGLSSGGAGTVSIEKYRPDQVVLKISASRPGFVFLSDASFPGWQARLDGRRAKLLRSWLAFRAVQVPAGNSELIFTYRPGPLRAALALSLAAVLSWVFAGLWLWRRQPAELDAAAHAARAAAYAVAGLAGGAIMFWAGWAIFLRR